MVIFKPFQLIVVLAPLQEYISNFVTKKNNFVTKIFSFLTTKFFFSKAKIPENKKYILQCFLPKNARFKFAKIVIRNCFPSAFF